MKAPLIVLVLIVLSLITAVFPVRTPAGTVQAEPDVTLFSSDGEALARIWDYSLTENQFCFSVTNISGSRTILGVGPDFGQRAITPTSFSQSGPGMFSLSPDRRLTDFYKTFSVAVGFALVVEHYAPQRDPDMEDGIQPGESMSFCVSGDFKGLKAKNIVKSLLVLAALDHGGGCPTLLFPLSCGGVTAQFTFQTSCEELCVSITNNSAVDISSVTLEFLGASFSGGFAHGIASGRSRTTCGSYMTNGSAIYQMTLVFADGTSCSKAAAEQQGDGGLSMVLGGRR